MSNPIHATPIVIPPEAQIPTQPSYNPLAATAQFKSPELLTYIELNIKAGIDLKWCNDTLLNWSKNVPALINRIPWVLDYLLVETEKYNHSCALALRNLAQDPEFTKSLAIHPRSREILSDILLKYENNEHKVDGELLGYTVDIIEAISSYFAPAPKDDATVLVLIRLFLANSNRALLIAMMRSFSRVLVRSSTSGEDCSFNLSDGAIWDNVTSFLLTNDQELIITSLDLLYQFTLAGPTRIATLLSSQQREEVIKTGLVNLLIYQLPVDTHPLSLSNLQPLRLVKRSKPAKPVKAPVLSGDLEDYIMSLSEPLRASTWLRCTYRAVAPSEVTQISLWKSYESQFEKSDIKMLAAVDFIKNVSKAFTGACAMIVNLDDGGRKFIIKGIEPRHEPVDVLTAEREANAGPLADSDSDSLLTGLELKASQEPIAPYIAPEILNEVNLSTVGLLNVLIGSNVGKESFKSVKGDIWHRVSIVPALAGELSDALKNLDL
ncbi:hypothetical protein WICPIJ_002124 [Wickerhamomyces pijperi]|uniref:RFX-type winged-helix domain-containing protein n=1 Tax=Wickerhamomyces pijperi TaxID=599730 RepID=A0A9P8QAA0_WICPI|nr:hypothetical protein WICPIJ_002124 [Wickerhamomyces pijperi]